MEPIYKTKRMELRILKPESAPDVLAFYKKNHEYLEPYEPSRIHGFYTLQFQRANLSYEYSAFLKKNFLRYWLVDPKRPHELLGSVSFNNFKGTAFYSATLGYKLDEDAQGKGLMQEALDFLLPLVFLSYSLHRMEAYVLPDNARSIRLLERQGFEREGLLKEYTFIQDQWKDHYLYAYLQ